MTMLFNLGNPLLETVVSWIEFAQIYEPPIDTAEEAALIFSGPRFFIALIAGLVLAFGFQLLLTNLSVAAGISYLGHQPSSSSHASDSSHSSSSLGSTTKKVTTIVGIGTLITVTIALFFACLLAVKLSLINNGLLGAIIGLVIWATYFCLMVWISSTTIGSLVGSVVNAATSGFQAILGTATSAIGAKFAKDQLTSSVESATAAVRRELTSGLDPETLRENLEGYLARIRPSGFDLKSISRDFEEILNEPDMVALAESNELDKVTRNTFVELVQRRTDLSKRDVNLIADQLYDAWQKVAGRMEQSSNRFEDLLNLLQSGRPEQLLSNELGSRLDRVIDELQKRRQAQSPSIGTMMLNGLLGTVVGRTDISDFDVEKIVNRINSVRTKVTEQSDKVTSMVKGDNAESTYSVIRTDVENYLLNTYPWEFSEVAINRDFRDVLYDPQANATVVRQEIERLNRMNFVELLRSRGLFTQDEIRRISFRLEAVRREVLQGVIVIEETEKLRDLQNQLSSYLRLAAKPTLMDQALLSQDLKPIFEDPDVGSDRLRDRLSRYNRSGTISVLSQRGDLSFEEMEQIASHIDRIIETVIADSEGAYSAARTRANQQTQKLEDYLRNTHRDELNPEGIRRDLRTLLDDPQAGIQDIRVRLSHFDRETLVQLLSQRQDLSQEQVEQILDQVEYQWYQVRHAPQMVVGRVSEEYDKLTLAIAEYLRNTDRMELNPDGIRHDLRLLLEDPKLGVRALSQRLSMIDRETLVQLLSQREDLSEEQVNQIIDEVLTTIRSMIRAPRRLALRAQSRVQDFQTSFADYLRNTDKAELNPEGIQRDLKMLAHDPRLGMKRLSDRISSIDRSTVVALLAQREDMSEEEANHIVDQVLSVRNQIVDQARAVQMRVQAVFDRILERLRLYLNSLERPELNYEGIRHDVRLLFDDPQSGFDALRDRLSHFDRGTLIALLSSRDDISEADAERIVAQIEGARNSVLRRAEWMQQQVHDRVSDLKHQAEKQLDETRKAAEVASWWLFATALISGAFSAIAGSLAVT